MAALHTDITMVSKKGKVCPLCGHTMTTRENATTFWENKKGRYAYYCENSNCLHKIPLLQAEIDMLRLEQSLLKWEIDIDTIGPDVFDQYELNDLLKSLKKTIRYLRDENGTLTAKEYFLQELNNPGGKKSHPWKWRTLVMPVALLLLTLGTIGLWGSDIGDMMQASILSILR